MLPRRCLDIFNVGALYTNLDLDDHLSNEAKHELLFTHVSNKDTYVQGEYLRLCIKSGNVELLKLALGAGIDPNVDCGGFVHGHPLHLAADMESPEMVNILIEKGADVNMLDSIGLTPLAYVHSTSMATILALMRHGGKSTDRRLIPRQQRQLVDYVDMMILLVKMKILPKDLLYLLSKFIECPTW